MAQDLTSLFNLAISQIGSRGAKVSSPDESSPEAEECRLWYEPTRDHVLRAAPWPSAKGYARLALLVERDTSADWVVTDPEPGWTFAYQQPTDLLYPRYLSTFERFSTGTIDTGNGRVNAIFTSAEAPILFYTRKETNISLWDTQLYFAIAHAVGYFISEPLHGKLNFARNAQEKANALILQARESAYNEGQGRIEVLPEWIAARGYEGAPVQDKFTYPYGPLIGASSGGANVR